MSVNLCTVTGTVLRPDATPFTGNVVFNSVIPQVVQGTVVPATQVTATTDVNGNINGGAGVSLIQGLELTVALSLDGNFNSQFTTIVPNSSTAQFSNLASGVLSLNAAAIATGTWTPLLQASTTSPSVTYTGQSGNYVIFGGTLVCASFSMTWSAQSGGAGGTTFIGGFPFTMQNVVDQWCGAVQINGFTFTGGNTYMILRGIQNQTQAAFIQDGSVAGGAFFPYSGITTGSGAVVGTISYRTI